MKPGKRQKFDVILGVKTEVREKRDRPEMQKDNTWYYLGLVGQIGFAIALPIALGVIGGAYVDKMFGMQPAATILFLLVGIGISFLGFFRIIEEVLHKRTH